MKWCDQYNFTISDIHWERIFLEFSITAKASAPEDTAFFLAPAPEGRLKNHSPAVWILHGSLLPMIQKHG